MRWTPSRSQSAESAPTTSSLKAIWASGPRSFVAKLRWGKRMASRTSPSMIAIDRIGCAFGSIAAQAPTCSSRRRGPSAIATVRNGLALGPAGCPGSTTATDAPCPIACLIAAASASPDAPPPAMTTSKMGAGSANADASFRPVVGRTTSPYRLLGRRAISESGFYLFKAFRRQFRVAVRRGVRGGRRWTLRQTSLHAGMVSLPRIFVDKNIRV